jgi:hypothetical protein
VVGGGVGVFAGIGVGVGDFFVMRMIPLALMERNDTHKHRCNLENSRCETGSQR